jgi:hypothetical protein
MTLRFAVRSKACGVIGACISNSVVAPIRAYEASRTVSRVPRLLMRARSMRLSLHRVQGHENHPPPYTAG